MQTASPSQEVRPEYHAHVRTEILPLIPRLGGTLLDVGGGIGATARRAKDVGLVDRAGVIDLVSVDPAEFGIDFHYTLNLEDPGTVERVLAEQGAMSVILCLDVLEHVADPWGLLGQLTKMLAPGGVIAASIPNVRYYRASLPLVFLGRWDLTDRGILDRTHLRWFTDKTAAELMTCTGLNLETLLYKPGGGRKIRLIETLTLGLFRGFTTVQFLILVRKPN